MSHHLFGGFFLYMCLGNPLFLYLRAAMKNKIIYTMALLAMLFAFGSCRMHQVNGTPYRVWHISKKTHRHWGADRTNSNRTRFWGKHRYGPRTHNSRGHFRD
jgi:hypothetical protein